MLDVFASSAFDTVSMTDAVNKLPFVPSRIGGLNLFTSKGITTTTAVIEEKDGKLALIPTAARGTRPNANTRTNRRVRSFVVPHLPLEDSVMADDVQGVRAFGQETALQTVAGLTNERLTEMRQNMEVTLEYHRIGAIHGHILDADGSSTIYNLFTEFGVTEQTQSFNFTAGAQTMRTKIIAVVRQIQNALGATPFTRVRALCGDQFFDRLIEHADIKAAYDRWQNGAFLRDDPRFSGFEFPRGVFWENYRGSVGGVDFIDTAHARFYPEGVPGLFRRYNAPAPFIETVNTVGRPFYSKRQMRDWGTGVDLHVEANPLLLCLRPRCLVKGTDDTP